MLRKTVVITLTKKIMKKDVIPTSNATVKVTLRHNIAQTTSARKAFIPFLLATIIK